MLDQSWIESLYRTIVARSDLLLPLLAAHMLADFPLQPQSWVKAKRGGFRSSRLWLHAALAALLGFLLLARLEAWWIIPPIFLGHAFIDGIKVQFKKGLNFFLLDQLAHFVLLVVIALILAKGSADIGSWLPTQIWGYLLAILFLWHFQGVFVGEATRQWRAEIKDVNGMTELRDAGLWIGRIERILIFVFIVSGSLEAVGLLVAAKSIFRFPSKDKGLQRVESEYFLIGTLISFSLAIFTGLLWRAYL